MFIRVSLSDLLKNAYKHQPLRKALLFQAFLALKLHAEKQIKLVANPDNQNARPAITAGLAFYLRGRFEAAFNGG